MMKREKSSGFTLIEVAIVLGVLGIVLLVAAMLLAGTMNSYAKVASETETIKQARQCLDMISRDMRESIEAGMDIQSSVVGTPPFVDPVFALLLVSARDINNTFVFTPGTGPVSNFPDPQSIILYYLNITPEGIPQLVRHQLYFAQDLNLFAGPFFLEPSPYTATDIVIRDVATSTLIPINRTTGGVGAVMPAMSPKVLMNGSVALDFAVNPPPFDTIDANLTCQFTDQYGRSVTTRLGTEIDPRNT